MRGGLEGKPQQQLLADRREERRLRAAVLLHEGEVGAAFVADGCLTSAAEDVATAVARLKELLEPLRANRPSRNRAEKRLGLHVVVAHELVAQQLHKMTHADEHAVQPKGVRGEAFHAELDSHVVVALELMAQQLHKMIHANEHAVQP